MSTERRQLNFPIPVPVKVAFCQLNFDSGFGRGLDIGNKLPQQATTGFIYLYEISIQDPTMDLSTLIPRLNRKQLTSLLRLYKYEKGVVPNSKESKGFCLFCKEAILQYDQSTFFIYNFLIRCFIDDPLRQCLVQLVASDATIFETFIKNVVDNIRFTSFPNKVNPMNALDIISIFHTYSAERLFSDVELLDYIVESLHNFILNTKSKTDIAISKTLELLIKFDALSYKQSNLVTCSNIEKILQFHISINKFNVDTYISTFKDKDSTWIENALLSLEFQIFPEVEDITYTTKSEDINWDMILSYLKVFSSIMSQSDTISLSSVTLRPLFNLLLKLCKIIDVPYNISSKFKMHVCTILSYAYKWNIPPFEHLKFFLVILSYASFSSVSRVRDHAYHTILSILEWDKDNILAQNLGVKDPSTFQQDVKDSLIDYNDDIKYLLINKNIQLSTESKFFQFNFNEFFFTLIRFGNLELVKTYKDTYKKYPKSLKKEMINQFETIQLEPFTRRYFSVIMKDNPTLDELKSLKLDSIPLYPGSTSSEVRMYLYILSLFKNNRKLDADDYMICDMFRFNEPDIVDALVDIFNSYELTNPILNGLINCLSKQNLVLLSVVQKSSKLYDSIASSDNKFQLMKPCLVGNPRKFVTFLEFFTELIQGKIIETESEDIMAKLLKNIETPYLEWELNDRLLFWEEIMKTSIEADESERFITNMDKFLKDLNATQKYVLVNKQMVIPLTSEEVENLSNDELNALILNKISAFKDTKTQQLKAKLKLPINSDNKRKKKQGEQIIKTHNLHSDLSTEDINVSITIYPNGKITNDRSDDGEKSKKLTAAERKALFLKNSSVNNRLEVAIKGSSSSVITKYSDHITKLIINDIFKGIFQSKFFIGRMMGILFKSEYNFTFATDNDILEALENRKLDNNDFANYLFIKLTFYLKSRRLFSATLKKHLSILKSTRKRMLLFIDEEIKI